MSDTTETRRMPIAGWQFLAMLVRAGLVDYRPVKVTLKLELGEPPSLAYTGWKDQPITDENREEMAKGMQYCWHPDPASRQIDIIHYGRTSEMLGAQHELAIWLTRQGILPALTRRALILASEDGVLRVNADGFGDKSMVSDDFAAHLARIGFKTTTEPADDGVAVS